ncbi:MAG: hypothetical protein QXD54_00625 [Candidatus Aenigmatarchaeota archaeon]
MKGQVFSLEAILAISLLVIFAIVVSFIGVTSFFQHQTYERFHYISQDSVQLLIKTRVSDWKEKLQELFDEGVLTENDLDKSLLDIIGSFWTKGDIENAKKVTELILNLSIPENLGYEVSIDEDTIAKREKPLKALLSVSTTTVSGYAIGKPVEGYMSTAFLREVEKKETCKVISVEQEGSGWSSLKKVIGVSYPFHLFRAPGSGCDDPTITIMALNDSIYILQYYNPGQGWQTILQKEILNKSLHVISNYSTANFPISVKPGYFRVLSPYEVSINVMTAEGSDITTLSTDPSIKYTGTEFILLGNARGTFEGQCNIRGGGCNDRRHCFMVRGFAFEDNTEINISYLNKVPFEGVAVFLWDEPGWTLVKTLRANATQPFDSNQTCINVPNGNSYTALKVVTNKPILLYRATHMDEMDMMIADTGTNWGKILYFAMYQECYSSSGNYDPRRPLLFYVYNRGKNAGKVKLQVYKGFNYTTGARSYGSYTPGWNDCTEISLDAGHMNVIDVDKSCGTLARTDKGGRESFWRLISDVDIGALAGGDLNCRMWGTISDVYMELPAVDEEWTTFETHMLYGGNPWSDDVTWGCSCSGDCRTTCPPNGNCWWPYGGQEFLATVGPVEITVKPEGQIGNVNITYVCAGYCAIEDSAGLHVLDNTTYTPQKIEVKGSLRKFILGGNNSNLFWGLEKRPPESPYVATAQKWIFEGNEKFRFYQGGSGNCWILTINPYSMQEKVSAREAPFPYIPPPKSATGPLYVTKKFSLPSDAVIKRANLVISLHEGYGTPEPVSISINGNKVWEEMISEGFVDEIILDPSVLKPGENTLFINMSKPDSYHSHIHPGFRLDVCYETRESEIEWDGDKIVKRYYFDNVIGHPTAWSFVSFGIPIGAKDIEITGYLLVKNINYYTKLALSNMNNPNYVLFEKETKKERGLEEYDREFFINNPSWAIPQLPPAAQEKITLDPSKIDIGRTNIISIYLDTKTTDDVYIDTFNEIEDKAEIVEGIIEIKYKPPSSPYGYIDLTRILPSSQGVEETVTITFPLNFTPPYEIVTEANAHFVASYSWRVNYSVNSKQAFISPSGRVVPTTVFIPVEFLNTSGLNTVFMEDLAKNLAHSGTVSYSFLIKDSVEYGKEFEKANGCTIKVWYDINFDDSADNFVEVKIGPEPDDFDPDKDAIDDALARLLDILNFYGDKGDWPDNPDGSQTNPIDIEIPPDIKFDWIYVGGIKSLWGPANLKIKVWT